MQACFLVEEILIYALIELVETNTFGAWMFVAAGGSRAAQEE